jgi:hypothetical protein
MIDAIKKGTSTMSVYRVSASKKTFKERATIKLQSTMLNYLQIVPS